MAKRIFLSLLVLVALSGYALPVSACSGGPPPWNDWLPSLLTASDTVVVGQYETLDDANANGIFRVQSYLKGGGSEHLVISASDVRAVENRRHVERNYGMCGLLEPKHLETTGTYIYFLKRQNTGTYNIIHERYFASVDTTTVIIDSTKGTLELDSTGLSANISAEVGSEAQKPKEDAPYPRTTPILLTTQSDQNFMLPVDSTALVSIPTDELADLRRDQYNCNAPCTAYSPNGLDKVYLQAEGSEPHKIEWFLPYVESNAIGQRIIFSATSDTYALWKDKQIQLYTLWYPKLGYPDDWIGDSYRIALFNSTPAGNSLQFPAVWSPDGRTLAYSTSEGLWLWDALNISYAPQLLIPTHSKIPIARYFSPQGRYLAIEDSGKRYNLDLVTRHELPDGYVSPNDRILLVFNTAAEKPTTLQVMYLAPGIRQFEYYPKVKYLNVRWLDDAYFQASITGSSYLKVIKPEPNSDPLTPVTFDLVEEPFYDTVRYHSSGIHWVQWELQVPYPIDGVQMRDFTYKTGPGLIEISVDGYSIAINDTYILSLASALSSPIKKAMWLPSAFYYAHD